MSRVSAADLIKDATERLNAAGVPNAAHDAKQLMKCVLSETAPSSAPADLRLISAEDRDRFEALVARRAQREPLQHITQSVALMAAELKVDHRALIPRDDSFEIVLEASERLCHREQDPLTIADLGTGSGVLLAESLLRFKAARGVAVEASAEAMSLAEENFIRLGLMDRVILFQGPWSEWKGWTACDLIVSNPPYICSDVIPTLEPEVKDYEPLTALDGGADGLDAYREIISLAALHMPAGAHLVLEIGYDQKQAVSDLLKTAGFTDLTHRKDMSANDRVIGASKT